MRNRIQCNWIVILLVLAGVWLAACNDANPTSVVRVTVVAGEERPLATATTTPMPPTASHIPPTATTQITATEVSSTPSPWISIPILSSQGQLAFIQNGVLFVETEPGVKEFKSIERGVSHASWSPQGNRLIYSLCNWFDLSYCYDIEDWVMYYAKTGKSVLLSEMISNLPEDFYGYPSWMQHGQKILFGIPFDGRISIVDLEAKTFSTPIRLFNVIGDWELPNERLLIQDHLGTYANSLGVYDINEGQLWSYPNPNPDAFDGANAGVLGFSAEHQLLAIFEPVHETDSFDSATLYQFDTETFELTKLWSKPVVTGTNFHISPTGKFIMLEVPGDNTESKYDAEALSFVDQAGNVYATIENSYFQNWRPADGAVIEKNVNSDQPQIVYLGLENATEITIFSQEENASYVSGNWSADGQYFAYSVSDSDGGKSFVYLWRFETNETELIQETTTDSSYQFFTWLPNSGRSPRTLKYDHRHPT